MAARAATVVSLLAAATLFAARLGHAHGVAVVTAASAADADVGWSQAAPGDASAASRWSQARAGGVSHTPSDTPDDSRSRDRDQDRGHDGERRDHHGDRDHGSRDEDRDRHDHRRHHDEPEPPPCGWDGAGH